MAAIVDGFQDENSTTAGQRNELSQHSRSLLALFVFALLSCLLYVWDGEVAADEIVEDVIHKTPDTRITSPPTTISDFNENETAHDSVDTNLTTEPPTTTPPIINTNIPHSENDDNSCSDVCEKRKTNRKTKFGGDLLDPNDIFRLANAAKDETIGLLREDYGDYFDPIFVNGTKGKDEQNRYHGMKGMNPDGPSRDRLKRKFKIKVLKMMTAVIASESNIFGCDCIQNLGTLTPGVNESTLTDIPDFYEKYVFANGGHSQAAGHGNRFSESYTAVFGRDVRRVWEAIGIQLIDRNHAMGAMRANPFIAACAKETFGIDVDFLAWNYGMTDGKPFSSSYYVYRGALTPGRPAIVILDSNQAKKLAPFEDIGLAIFHHRLEGPAVAALPDGSPDGMPLPDSEVEKIPRYALNVKCNGRLEGRDICFDSKMRWSCTQAMKEEGSACICPNVGKRSSWHMGYKIHALFGHLIALPFLEIMIEALKELATSTTEKEELLEELQKEENADYEEFLSKPLVDLVWGQKEYLQLGLPNETLFETWFKGPNICRTSYLPSESRFLGVMTDTDKTGGPAIPGRETYDTGDFSVTNIDNDGNYNFVEDGEPLPGVFSLLNYARERSGWQDQEAWDKECPALVMPDYKDFFYAPLLDGKASITFPSEKEKAYYGYNPSKFKGVIGLVLPLQAEPACKSCHPHDLILDDFEDGKVTITVNSNPVTNIRIVRNAMILEGDGGSVYWEPNVDKQNYKIEFEVAADVAQYRLRLGTIILY